MLDLLTASFEAHNAERNHHRSYVIRVGRDLLGDWVVSLNYGRIGRGSQERRYGGRDPEALRSVVSNCLRQRLSAPRRLGCGYRLTSLSADAEVDADYWLPSEVLSRFR